MNNVLISRDHMTTRLVDIDGGNKGSIEFPSEYILGAAAAAAAASVGSKQQVYHKPALDIELSNLLPLIVQQLICGKGCGGALLISKISQIRQKSWSSDTEAKEFVHNVIRENFFPDLPVDTDCKHLGKVTEWFYAMLLKRSPWTNWTSDIYDAMRCIDHLPIS
mmetsp:Transcript_44563/g.65565  ORF Transcript_44563/g.65565 Transcript_44563/m.65565 type:complete len:164 (-) Transcript_44563:88-579(-)